MDLMPMAMHVGHGVLNKMGIRVGRYARISEGRQNVVMDEYARSHRQDSQSAQLQTGCADGSPSR